MSPEKAPTKPVDIYIRVSEMGERDEADESFLSAKLQEERCRALITSKGYKAGKVFTDLDVTGRKMSRPEFDKVLARALTGESGGICVWKLNRFGRNARGVEELTYAVDAAGGTLMSSYESVDTASSMGRFFLRLIASIAELESDQIADTWKLVHASQNARGVVSGPTPLGYVKDENKRLIPNGHADTVREAYRMRAEDKAGWGDVARFLTASGAEPTARRDRKTGKVKPFGGWTPTSARKLLGSRVYLGEARFGKLVEEDAHEALVDEKTFRLANRKGERLSGERGDGPLLGGGLCRCGTCGRGLVLGSTKAKATGKEYKFLRCQSRGGGHTTVALDKVEPYLIREALKRHAAVEIEAKSGADPEIEKALALAVENLAELNRLVASGELPATAGTAKVVAAAEAEVETLQAQADENGTSSTWWGEVAGIDPESGEWTLLNWGSDPDADSAAVATVPLNVPVARKFLKEMLGSVTVAPGLGSIEDRVTIEK